MSDVPQIRMRYGWLLSSAASEPLNELWGDGTPLRSFDEYETITKNYHKAWQPYEKKILSAMQNITGLKFRQAIIDVYIAPWFAAFSDPMVIGVTYKPDRFIDVLTHELLHRLLTDNTTLPYEYNLLTAWKGLYGEELDFSVLVHIPVHAIHKAIMVDELKEPVRLDREMDKITKYPEYKAAWDYVEKHGYKRIIADLQKLYDVN